MVNVTKLSKEDILSFQTNCQDAIEMTRYYSSQYNGKEHYEELGGSCTVSVNGTIGTIIGSAQYLDGVFIMADTVDIEKVADWFMENREYNCNRSTLLFYMANFIKRKINKMYREINQGVLPSSRIALISNAKSRKEYEKQVAERRKTGVKIIRNK